MRHIHLVGSEAAASEETLRDRFEVAGDHALSMPYESPNRTDWVVEELKALRYNPAVEVVRDGDFSSYEEMADMRVRGGYELRADTIRLTYADYALEGWGSFDRVRRDTGHPDMPLQVGIPGTLQIPMFAFGGRNPLEGFRHRKPFAEALQREVDLIVNDPEIAGEYGNEATDKLVFQLEIPAEIGGMSMVPGRLQPLTDRPAAWLLARGIVAQAEGLPDGMRTIIHNCYGDLGRKAFSTPPTVDPVVALSKAIIRQWPNGKGGPRLEAIHFPFGSGESAPPEDTEYYKPLGKLAAVLDSMPGDRRPRLIAGFAHEEPSLKQQTDTLNRIEDLMGSRVDVAPACGLARCTPEVADAIVRRCVELANA